jgi:hypothetical protein
MPTILVLFDHYFGQGAAEGYSRHKLLSSSSRVRNIPLLVLAAVTMHAQPAAEVRGSVVDARGGAAGW